MGNGTQTLILILRNSRKLNITTVKNLDQYLNGMFRFDEEL
jgi:hypothetical protein